MIAGVSAFSAARDGKTLLVVMDDPGQTKIWIESADAWSAYTTTAQGKRPMCLFNPPTFKMTFEDGTSITWSAKLASNSADSDLLLYDLERQAEN